MDSVENGCGVHLFHLSIYEKLDFIYWVSSDRPNFPYLPYGSFHVNFLRYRCFPYFRLVLYSQSQEVKFCVFC